MSRATRGLLALLVGVAGLVAALGPAPVRAAGITFGNPTAKPVYAESITFSVPIDVSGPLARLELRLEFPGALGPFVVIVPTDASTTTATYVLETSGESHLVPNTTIEATWAAYPAVGDPPVLSKPVTVRYADTEHDWQHVTGDVVTVYWYAGDRAFAERALAIGDAAVKQNAELLGVADVADVDFFIYGDRDSFRKALGPGTRENVGGQAQPAIRTLFAQISPDMIDDPWVGIVIPHELIHIVFDQAVENPFRGPPRWVNEGIAVYLSEGYTSTDRNATEAAVADGTLMPLTALTAQFPTDPQLTSLAYSESVSAIDHLVRIDGDDALTDLADAYATGPTDDEAFKAVTGLDVAGFQARWLAELGAQNPIERGPQPNPPGPVPPGWEGAAPGQPTAAPGSTSAPGTSASPGATAAPGDARGGGDDLLSPGALAFAGVVLVVVIVAGVLAKARGRTPSP